VIALAGSMRVTPCESGRRHLYEQRACHLGLATTILNYDRHVTIADFIDLAANFRQSLMPASPADTPQSAVALQMPIVGTAFEITKDDEADSVVSRRKNQRLNHGSVSRRHQLHHSAEGGDEMANQSRSILASPFDQVLSAIKK